jgi:hypothetical protein
MITRIRFEGITVHVCEIKSLAEVVFADVTRRSLDKTVRAMIDFAKSERLDIEWKTYGHDLPEISTTLPSFGFKECPLEKVMIRCLNDYAELSEFSELEDNIEMKKVVDQDRLADLQIITREVYGRSFDSKLRALSKLLAEYPQTLSIYISYVNSEPAASGRALLFKGSSFCGLYGGQTRERFRGRGLFSRIVHARLVEGKDKGYTYGIVDALPTSEPILRKLGFEALTTTRPYVLERE